jgi:hypothetical protein
VTTEAGSRTEFVGGNETRAAAEKLVNIATRGPVGGTAGSLIGGFVVSGDAPKQVLVRAVGPTLGALGVTGALRAARLELFAGQAPIASNTAWGRSAGAAEIAAAAARAGAFALDAASEDAAVLITLEPGPYTAVVSGVDGATGVALVEVYDASQTSGDRRRVVNIASRALAGAGENTLTAGFVIAGEVPKRVLIRGAGPALSAFGVGGAMADPRLRLYRGSTEVAGNENWDDVAGAAGIREAAAAVGAFAFAAGSRDAALLLHLEPGPYTAQLSGGAGASGTALIEVYEVP